MYELANLNRNQKKIVDSLLPESSDSPLRKLCDLVFSDEKVDDHTGSFLIYGNRKKSSSTFTRLKSRLKDILLQAFMINPNNLEAGDPRINESIIGYRQVFIARLLNIKRSRLGIEMMEKSITKSMKYHSAESVLFQARLLVSYYGQSSYNRYKFKKYSDIQDRFFKYYQWEVKAERYYAELQRNQLQSLANPSDDIIQKARQYVEELDSVSGINSFNFLNFRYRVKAAYLEYTKKYDQLLEISKKAYKEFSAPQYRSTRTLAGINLRIVYALLQENKFDEVLKIGYRDLNRLAFGSFGWYLIAHYTLKAELYKGDYAKAVSLISKMMDTNKFKKVPNNFQEIFNTTLGYIHLIVDSGIAGEPKQLKKQLPEFKLGKFLNTIPVFSKDKRGINVSIHLMHIAFLLQRKDFNSIIDRVDSLNQYAYRYLRKDDSFRSNCMIKMVIQMTKADFNPIRTERYTKDLRKQLGVITLAGSGENIEVEVIPFEILWSIMRRSL